VRRSWILVRHSPAPHSAREPERPREGLCDLQAIAVKTTGTVSRFYSIFSPSVRTLKSEEGISLYHTNTITRVQVSYLGRSFLTRQEFVYRLTRINCSLTSSWMPAFLQHGCRTVSRKVEGYWLTDTALYHAAEFDWELKWSNFTPGPWNCLSK